MFYAKAYDENTQSYITYASNYEEVKCDKKEIIDAYKSKINGVICSGLESKMIKENTSVDFLVVSPGIRYPDSNSDDQHRICTPKMAKENGCDYIVVGRLITKSTNPLEMYKKVVNDFMGEN